jgi:hypothetical protein
MNHEARKLTYRVDLPGGDNRLREMILYVSKKSKEMPRYGKTKLNKILWDADFSAFAERRVPVTGRPYFKLQAGPAPIEMATLLAEMKESSLITIEAVDFGNGFIEQRVVALVEPSLHYFSPDDLAYMDRAIERLWSLTAKEASDASHGIAWSTRDELDPLPYETAFLVNERLQGAALNRTKRKAEELGWKSA